MGVFALKIGLIIRGFRKDRRITLNELAGNLEISPSYLSAIERNIRRPSIQILKKIGDALNIPISYLLGTRDDVLSGKKLKYMRESRNLSTEDLSEICDLPVRLIEKFEAGEEVPDLASLKKLSEGLNVTIKYFLDRGENNNLGDRRVMYSPLGETCPMMFRRNTCSRSWKQKSGTKNIMPNIPNPGKEGWICPNKK